MSAATGPAWCRCAVRTTCRAAATWARFPTSSSADRTSRTPRTARSSSASTAERFRPSAAGTSPRCSRRWSTARCKRCTSSARIRRSPRRMRTRALRLLEGLDHIVVQDIFLTRTAELAHVVLPAAAAWCESEGTVTSSERRVQRVRKALNPPGDARDDISILCDLARRLGHDWGTPSAEDVWNEIRRLVAMARRHELPASRRARRAAVAVSRPKIIRAARCCTIGCGAIRSAARRRRSCRSNSSRRSTRSRPTFRCG